jgi:hypothetical protein
MKGANKLSSFLCLGRDTPPVYLGVVPAKLSLRWYYPNVLNFLIFSYNNATTVLTHGCFCSHGHIKAKVANIIFIKVYFLFISENKDFNSYKGYYKRL